MWRSVEWLTNIKAPFQSHPYNEIVDQSKILHPPSEPNDRKTRENLLRSLWYLRMLERVNQIQQPHGVIYKWILEPDVGASTLGMNRVEPTHPHSEEDWDNVKSIIKYCYIKTVHVFERPAAVRGTTSFI